MNKVALAGVVAGLAAAGAVAILALPAGSKEPTTATPVASQGGASVIPAGAAGMIAIRDAQGREVAATATDIEAAAREAARALGHDTYVDMGDKPTDLNDPSKGFMMVNPPPPMYQVATVGADGKVTTTCVPAPQAPVAAEVKK